MQVSIDRYIFNRISTLVDPEFRRFATLELMSQVTVHYWDSNIMSSRNQTEYTAIKSTFTLSEQASMYNTIAPLAKELLVDLGAILSGRTAKSEIRYTVELASEKFTAILSNLCDTSKKAIFAREYRKMEADVVNDTINSHMRMVYSAHNERKSRESKRIVHIKPPNNASGTNGFDEELFDVIIPNDIGRMLLCYENPRFVGRYHNNKTILPIYLLFAHTVARSLAGGNIKSIYLSQLMAALNERLPRINWLKHLVNDKLFFGGIIGLNDDSTTKVVSDLATKKFVAAHKTPLEVRLRLNSFEKSIIPTLILQLWNNCNGCLDTFETAIKSFELGVTFEKAQDLIKSGNILDFATEDKIRAKLDTTLNPNNNSSHIGGRVRRVSKSLHRKPGRSDAALKANYNPHAHVLDIVSKQLVKATNSAMVTIGDLSNLTFERTLYSADCTKSLNAFKHAMLRVVAESPKRKTTNLFIKPGEDAFRSAYDATDPNADAHFSEEAFNEMKKHDAAWDLAGTQISEISLRTGFCTATISKLMKNFHKQYKCTKIARFSEHETECTTYDETVKYMKKNFPNVVHTRIVIANSSDANRSNCKSIVFVHANHFLQTSVKLIRPLTYVLDPKSLQTYGRSPMIDTSVITHKKLASTHIDVLGKGIIVGNTPKRLEYSKDTLKTVTTDIVEQTLQDSSLKYVMKQGSNLVAKVSNLLQQSDYTIGCAIQSISDRLLSSRGVRLKKKYHSIATRMNGLKENKQITYTKQVYNDDEGNVREAILGRNSAGEFVVMGSDQNDSDQLSGVNNLRTEELTDFEFRTRNHYIKPDYEYDDKGVLIKPSKDTLTSAPEFGYVFTAFKNMFEQNVYIKANAREDRIVANHFDELEYTGLANIL